MPGKHLIQLFRQTISSNAGLGRFAKRPSSRGTTVYTHLGQGINVLRDPPKSPRWRAAALEKRGTLNPVPPFFKGG